MRGPKVEILGPVNKKYKVKFYDMDTNSVIYETTLRNNMWSVSNKRYFVKWKIEVYEVVNENWEMLIETHILDLSKKSVKVVFDTNSLGDIISYIGTADAFQKKHNCELTCVVFNTELVELFSKNYKNIKFSRTNDGDDNYYSTYYIGYYDQENWDGNMKKNPKHLSLALVAANILGLPEVKTKAGTPVARIVPTNIALSRKPTIRLRSA